MMGTSIFLPLMTSGRKADFELKLPPLHVCAALKMFLYLFSSREYALMRFEK
jgi:hypothetical protein